MESEVQALISRLALEPHVEGGYFREVFRSKEEVEPTDGRGPRSASTAIHFLLPRGQVSRWHVLRSVETWTFLAGEPLELFIAVPEPPTLERFVLGPPGAGEIQARVPAGGWQAARPLGSHTLALCTVEPGFDAADFHFLADLPEARTTLSSRWPDLAGLL